MVIPYFTLDRRIVDEMTRIAEELNSTLRIRGPYNIQFLISNGAAYVIELNLRASRSMPFTSKVTEYNLMRAAVEAALQGRIEYGFREGPSSGFKLVEPEGWWGVKSPQFSWQRLRGAYPGLGPEMRSTGEVAALGWSLHEALLKSWLSVSGNELPEPGSAVLVYCPTGRCGECSELSAAARYFAKRGYTVYTVKGMAVSYGEPLEYNEALKLVRGKVVRLVATTGYTPEKDYEVRRLAADAGLTLVLNARLARMLAEAATSIDIGDLDALELKEYWSRSRSRTWQL